MSNAGTPLVITTSSSRGEMYPRLGGESGVCSVLRNHRPPYLAPLRSQPALIRFTPPPRFSQAPQPGVTLPMQRDAAPSN